MPSTCLITGATGFVGGHLAQASQARGLAVRTLARPGSETSLLDRLGVEVYRGDLADPDAVRKAAEGVDLVFHCAAKVGDRGPVEDYRAVNVEAMRTLLDAVKGRPLRRFVHLSSLGVYEARHHQGTDESEPLPERHMDGYTQTKVESERLALHYQRDHAVPVVVLRPGFIYGPRDRTLMPEIIKNLAAGKVHYLGGDLRLLNTIYVGNLVEAFFRAIESPAAVGQVYNLTDGEAVTRQRFFEAVCGGLDLPPPHQRLPRRLAALVVRVLRWQGLRAERKGRQAWLPPARYKFLLLNLDFSIEKAKRELGYRPPFTFDQGMAETIAWYKQNR
jgi:2-alkyl-3-oxoalkanoate reductase